ncbi:MAG: trypsin-like peptidase domain-containing protein [Planctomycetaceae bacterium]|jgi:S1-C subfamily serine protease|nr:trypsin-like peptidase domain-containing protein [Planctomycetaceae bacterium]
MFGIQIILSTFILAAIPAPQDATLLFVTTPACESCRQVAPLVREITEMGYSVEIVDASQHPELVRDQLKVSHFPTFLMLSHDQIIDRVVGGGNPISLKPRILYMFERAAELRRKNNEIIQASFVTPQPTSPPTLPPTPLPTSANTINKTEMLKTNEIHTNNLTNSSTNNLSKNSETVSPWITSSVKLRVDADNTHSWGTGTIIDTRKGEALILTCGHIFRDSQGKGKIEVHLFGQNSSVRVFGRCLCYDLEIDLALVVIVPPCPVQAVPIAPPQYQISPKQRVMSVGCDSGANPTVREHYVMSTNRVGTPRENVLPFHYIQVFGAPVSGRSGGGLFTEDGYLIGVCNTADPVQNDGHFVPPQMIRYVLQSMQLSEIYENPSLTDSSLTGSSPVSVTATTVNPATKNVAITNPLPTNPAISNSVSNSATTSRAVPNPAFANPVTPFEPLKLEPLKTAIQPISATIKSETKQNTQEILGMDEKQRATLDEIKRRQQDGDEVILIVRSRRNPEIPTDVIFLNGSDQFLDALTKHEPVSNPSSYNPVIFSSHETHTPNLRPLNSPLNSPLDSSPVPIADRQPVSFPVLH